jgi:hypothetical protein
MSGVTVNMSPYEAMSRISIGLIDKSLEQTKVQAEGLLSMLPPAAGLTERGGLLDVRA